MKGFYTQNEIENGASLQHAENNHSKKDAKSILETYPEYNFKPTSINDKRGASQRIKLFFATLVFGFLGLFLAIGGFDFSFEREPLGFAMLIGLVIIIVIYYLLIIKKWYQNTPTKSQVADYIQTTDGKTICVKDGKFGVLNNFNKNIIIPTMYDKLTWTQKDQLLRAETMGESFLIDIHNNRLK